MRFFRGMENVLKRFKMFSRKLKSTLIIYKLEFKTRSNNQYKNTRCRIILQLPEI